MGKTENSPGDEALVVKGGKESRETLENKNEHGDEDCNVRRIGLEGRLVRECIPRHALRFAAGHESNVGKENADPGKTTKDAHSRSQVGERLATTAGEVEEGKGAKEAGEAKGNVGYTHAVAAKEDTRGLAIDGKTVQRPRGNVQVAIRGRKRKDEKRTIDD